MLNIERELARMHGEIDSMKGRLDYMERQVAESTLDLTLQIPEVTPPETKPGPVVCVFVGIWTAVKWLFVWEKSFISPWDLRCGGRAIPTLERRAGSTVAPRRR